MAQKYTYRDLSLGFKPHPVTGDVICYSDVKAVMQSLKNLLQTSGEEYLMNPDIAGDLNKLLFDFNDPISRFSIQSKVEEVIRNHEPRIELISVSVTQMESNLHAVKVTIRFMMLNNETPYEESIVVNRTR